VSQDQIAKLPLYDVHIVAKNTIYSVEALESAIRTVHRAIDCHAVVMKESAARESTRQSLLYCIELLYSTRQRTLSVENRMKNVVNLV
jgi:hypothetical protein